METKNEIAKEAIEHFKNTSMIGAITALIPLGLFGLTLLFHLTSFNGILPFLAIMGIVGLVVIFIGFIQILAAKLFGIRLYLIEGD
jgi:hypothetical protein